MALPEITVEQLAELRSSGTPHTLIDVREPHEYDLCKLGGALIPLGEIPARYSEIPREGRVVIHCRSGARSGKAVEYLQSLGYSNLENLAGGILAWSDRVDPSVPKY